MDDGFWYSIPPHLESEIELGRIVRVPLSGRRIRGWVVEVAQRSAEGLKAIATVSGSRSVFDRLLLRSLTWAAHQYVAPLAVLLGRATPPNLPRRQPQRRADVTSGPALSHPLQSIAASAAQGRKRPSTAIVGRWQELEWIAALRPVLAGGRSVLLLTATGAEAAQVAKEAEEAYGGAVIAAASETDAAVTEAWERAQTAGSLLVATPRAAVWQIAQLALVLVVEEGRRAMKDRQTPTLHVRDVLRNRARIEGWALAFLGPTPSVELLAAGAEVMPVGNRAWPLVEVVDRSQEPPGVGYLSDRVLAALRTTLREEGSCFVFTHRRVGFASMRCVRCRAIRGCVRCGARLGRVFQCPQCGASVGPCASCGSEEFEEMGTVPDRLIAELDRRLGQGAAGTDPSRHRVVVGTERDLAGLEPVSVAVAADADGMLEGAGYRQSEEALRQLARVANVVRRGRGHRMMVQTSRPDSDLITALKRGDPIPYLENVLVERARGGFPPATEMMAVEIRGETPQGAESNLRSLPAAAILGPARRDGGQRWLLTGDLSQARLGLRKLAGQWRESGATVRIDVDPIDL